MKDVRNRRLRLLALVVYASVVICWICYQPVRRDALFRAMPEVCRLVTAHRNLSEHWQMHLTHPLVNEMVSAFTPISPAKLGADPAWQSLVRWLTGSDTVSGWRKHDVGLEQADGFAATHVGGPRSVLFRLLLTLRWVPGLGRLQVSPSGTRYLDFTPDTLDLGPPSRRVLSFAVYEGILLAAWATNPDAVQHLRWRLEYGKTVSALFGDRLPGKDRQPDADLHRIWWAIPPSGASAPDVLGIRLEALSAERATLRLDLPKVWGQMLATEPGRRKPAGPINLPAFIPADAPALALLVSPGVYLSLMREHLDIDSFQESLAGERILVWASGKPYEGRILGVLTPALFAAMPADRFPELESVQALLDKVNARWDLGLTHRAPRHATDRSGRERLLDTSRLGFGTMVSAQGHHGILAYREQWLVVGSSASSWRTQVAASAGNRHSAWSRWLAATPTISDDRLLRVWASPGALSQVLRYTIALARLGMRVLGAVTDHPADVMQHPWLLGLVDLLETLAPHGDLFADLACCPDAPDDLQLTLHIGALPL